MKTTWRELCGEFDSLSRRILSARLRSGHPVTPDAVADRDYLGFSLGMPAIADKLLWKRFRKSFRSDGGAVRGWNTRVDNSTGDFDWTPMTKAGAPVTFGPFDAVQVHASRMPFDLPGGLVLDYGRRNPRWHPLARLRDPLVAIAHDRTDVLLGWSYLQVVGRGVPTPSYFLLFEES